MCRLGNHVGHENSDNFAEFLTKLFVGANFPIIKNFSFFFQENSGTFESRSFLSKSAQLYQFNWYWFLKIKEFIHLLKKKKNNCNYFYNFFWFAPTFGTQYIFYVTPNLPIEQDRARSKNKRQWKDYPAIVLTGDRGKVCSELLSSDCPILKFYNPNFIPHVLSYYLGIRSLCLFSWKLQVHRLWFCSENKPPSNIWGVSRRNVQQGWISFVASTNFSEMKLKLRWLKS